MALRSKDSTRVSTTARQLVYGSVPQHGPLASEVSFSETGNRSLDFSDAATDFHFAALNDHQLGPLVPGAEKVVPKFVATSVDSLGDLLQILVGEVLKQNDPFQDGQTFRHFDLSQRCLGLWGGWKLKLNRI